MTVSRIREPYPFADPNEPVELHEGGAVLRQSATELRGTARVFLAWLPTPSISFELSGESNDLIDIGAESRLELEGLGLSTAVFLTRYRSNGDVEGQLTEPVSIGTADDLSSIIFMLANTPAMIGDPIEEGATFWRGRVTLESHPWRVNARVATRLPGRVGAGEAIWRLRPHSRLPARTNRRGPVLSRRGR